MIGGDPARRVSAAIRAHFRHHVSTYTALVALLAAAFFYYFHQWGTFDNFVIAIDHHPRFMQDFAGFYYPMGRKILEDPTPILAYYYTAFFAVAISPICQLELPDAMIVWGAIQVACFLVVCVVPIFLLRLSRWRIVLYAVLCVSSFPILHNFKWGQVSIIVLACVLSALLLQKKKLGVLAGALVALAAAIKLYPALFLLYFILKKDLRACISFVVFAVALYAILPAIFLGFSSWYDFEAAVFTSISEARWVARDVNSQYFVHVCARWLASISDQPPGETAVSVMSVIGYVLAAVCIGASWLLGRRISDDKNQLQVVPIFLSTPFIVKTSWPHYFVFLPFCQVVVLSHFASSMGTLKKALKLIVAIPVASICLSNVVLFNHFQDRKEYSSYGILFLSAFLLLISAAMAVFVRRREEKG